MEIRRTVVWVGVGYSRTRCYREDGRGIGKSEQEVRGVALSPFLFPPFLSLFPAGPYTPPVQGKTGRKPREHGG